MVAEVITHYRARQEAARQLALGTRPTEIVHALESQGLSSSLAHEALREAQRAVSHAPVKAALRSAMAGGFWIVAGVGVLLLTYGLGSRVPEDLLVALVLLYGLVVMAIGLLRAFRAGDDHDRSAVFRLFVMAVLLVIAAGGLAAQVYKRDAALDAIVGSVTDDLDAIQRFNHVEAALGSRLELAGEDAEAGLAALRELTPELAGFVPLFAEMERRGRRDTEDMEPQEALLMETFAALTALYAGEARLYADLEEAVKLEPDSVAWLRAVPLLQALDRSYGRIDLHSRALRDQLEAVSP